VADIWIEAREVLAAVHDDHRTNASSFVVVRRRIDEAADPDRREDGSCTNARATEASMQHDQTTFIVAAMIVGEAEQLPMLVVSFATT